MSLSTKAHTTHQINCLNVLVLIWVSVHLIPMRNVYNYPRHVSSSGGK